MTAVLGLLLAASHAARPDVPVKVRCDDMVVENRAALARCEGHVVAVRQNVTLTCEHALARYDGAGRVSELTCRGRVHVLQKLPKGAPARTADGDQAVYREAERTLTLTGHAHLTQGADELEGEPIVFHVDEDRVVTKGATLVGRAKDAVHE